jgi:hypothetical protein
VRLTRGHTPAIGFAAAAALTVAFASCALYDGSLLLPAAPDASNGEGGVDPGAADSGSADAFVDPCAHISPPPPPAADDGNGDVDVVLAVGYLRLLPNGTATVNHPHAPTGFDLDHTCTCPSQESCTPRDTERHCDADGGADYSANGIFNTFVLIDPVFTDDHLNDVLRKGLYTILFRIKSYNGGRNDKQVSAIVYISNGMNGGPDGGATAPKYDGTDVWSIDPSSLVGGASLDGGATCEGNDNICIPFFADTQAYVSNGVLVAHIDFPLVFSAGTSQIKVALSGTEIAAPLLFDGSHYRIDEGQLGGRWSTGGLLTALQGAADPLSPGDFLCGSSATYLNLKAKICSAADINADPSKDDTAAKCDALSLAVSFSATPAHLGAIFANPPGPQPCGATYKDDCP